MNDCHVSREVATVLPFVDGQELKCKLNVNHYSDSNPYLWPNPEQSYLEEDTEIYGLQSIIKLIVEPRCDSSWPWERDDIFSSQYKVGAIRGPLSEAGTLLWIIKIFPFYLYKFKGVSAQDENDISISPLPLSNGIGSLLRRHQCLGLT